MRIYFSYPKGKKRAITMSYDDGVIQDRRLVEIFNRYNIKATFHLNSGLLGSGNHIEKEEVASLYKGHEISVHTYTHPFLQNMPVAEIVSEVLEDRNVLESLAGYPVRGMSYPFGTYNSDVLNTLPSLGIEYSRTVASHGRFELPDNFLTWHPTCHHNHNITEKYQEFLNSKAVMPLLYVWGHSYEFDYNNNWNMIEGFCETVSGDDDTWYATNIEIADYISALKNLRFSVDRKLVYNPSAISVWISVDGETAEVKSGENKKLL